MYRREHTQKRFIFFICDFAIVLSRIGNDIVDSTFDYRIRSLISRQKEIPHIDQLRKSVPFMING